MQRHTQSDRVCQIEMLLSVLGSSALKISVTPVVQHFAVPSNRYPNMEGRDPYLSRELLAKQMALATFAGEEDEKIIFSIMEYLEYEKHHELGDPKLVPGSNFAVDPADQSSEEIVARLEELLASGETGDLFKLGWCHDYVKDKVTGSKYIICSDEYVVYLLEKPPKTVLTISKVADDELSLTNMAGDEVTRISLESSTTIFAAKARVAETLGTHSLLVELLVADKRLEDAEALLKDFVI